METFKVVFHGPMAFAMAREIDKTFRAFYNVYGGKLIRAYKGVEQEQVAEYEYTANWWHDPINGVWFPRFEHILRSADKALNNNGFGIQWSEKPNDGGNWYE